MTTTTKPAAFHFERDDGGRAAAGYRGDAGDCFVRACAIALGRPYLEVYREVAELNSAMPRRGKRPVRSARNGVRMKVAHAYMDACGAAWTPTMAIGSGCTVHLAQGELPDGWLVARLSGHFCAVVNGTVFDTYDPTRDGTRCVYGYWTVDRLLECGCPAFLVQACGHQEGCLYR